MPMGQASLARVSAARICVITPGSSGPAASATATSCPRDRSSNPCPTPSPSANQQRHRLSGPMATGTNQPSGMTHHPRPTPRRRQDPHQSPTPTTTRHRSDPVRAVRSPRLPDGTAHPYAECSCTTPPSRVGVAGTGLAAWAGVGGAVHEGLSPDHGAAAGTGPAGLPVGG
jgi:hypothetical protein